MGAVLHSEAVPGLVVHLDTGVLRAIGGSTTNAETGGGGDRAVVGPHYFLLLEIDGATGNCIAVPLFSKWAPGSERLDETRKSGLADKWLGVDSFFSRWQHWTIPLAAITPSSHLEESDSANRRRYSANDTKELERITAWKDLNRAAFRAL